MSIRVSDPDIPAANWLALVIMSLTMMVPEAERSRAGSSSARVIHVPAPRHVPCGADHGVFGHAPKYFLIRPRVA